MSTLLVSGGFTHQNKHIENRISIENMATYFVKNKITEWKSFKDIYFQNGKLNPSHYPKFLEVLNDIYILPFYTTSENELLYLINNIYKSEPSAIINGILKSINLFHVLKSAVRHLFMIYKVYIEKLIEIYVNTRNKYIDKYKSNIESIKKNEKNDFDSLLLKWNTIDRKNNVDTSSIILFFNFPPPSVKLEKTIPKINWEIKSKDAKHKKVTNAIKSFLADIKTNDFNYIGFCPHVFIQRFQALLKFPTGSLLKLINIINAGISDTSISRIDNLDFNTVIHDITGLHSKIDAINNSIKPNIKIKRANLASIEKFNKTTSLENKVEHFSKYADAFIKLYEDVIPHLIKKEKLVNDLAININTVSTKIQALVNNL